MYKTTVSQFVIMWVFVVLNILILVSDNDPGKHSTYGFVVFLMFFFMIFYTIGWRNYRKQNKSN